MSTKPRYYIATDFGSNYAWIVDSEVRDKGNWFTRFFRNILDSERGIINGGTRSMMREECRRLNERDNEE